MNKSFWRYSSCASFLLQWWITPLRQAACQQLFLLLLEIQWRDWHLEMAELWNVNLYVSVTRSLFCLNKWTSAVSQKRISPNDRENKLNQTFCSFYLQALIFDTGINASFLNVTFSLPVAMQQLASLHTGEPLQFADNRNTTQYIKMTLKPDVFSSWPLVKLL